MASEESTDFSSDTHPHNQLNKYGFTSPQNFSSSMYPSMPGYFHPPAVNDNPLQELQMMGFKDMNYTEITGSSLSSLEPFGFELRLDRLDRVFTGFGVGKRKARKAAAQSALDYCCEATVLPEGIKIRLQKFRAPFMHPMTQYPWSPMGQYPPGYPGYSAPSMPQQLGPAVPSAPMTLLERPSIKETPLSILQERYPEAQVRNMCTSTITIGDHEFSVTVPGNNSHHSRMHASVAALKELDGLEFPDWDQRLERVTRSYKDPSNTLLHPVSLLLKEYGTRNVIFKHDTLSEPCTVSINDSGNNRAYNSPICTTKRQAKYEAAIFAVKELGLDKKYTNILPYAQMDRKRKHNEINDDVTQLGYSIETSMGIDEGQKQDSDPVEELTYSQSPVSFAPVQPVTAPTAAPGSTETEPEAKPVLEPPENQPPQEKKSRMEPPDNTQSDMGSDSPSNPEQKPAPAAAYPSRHPRGGRRTPRGGRVVVRGPKTYTGGYRSSPRYF